MKRIVISLILLISILTMAHAAVDAEEIPPGLFGGDSAEESDLLSQYIVNTIQPLLKRVSVLVGGIFGLYMILILARIHYERKKVKLLKDIRYDLDHLNMHYKVPHSRERNGFFKKLWCKAWKKNSLKGSKENKKLKK